MNKFKATIIGSTILAATLLGGPAANAAPDATTCQSIGETVYKGDPRYLPKLDKDADGRICESHKIELPANGSALPENGVNPGTYVPSAGGNTTGQVDANGNPIQYDSNGNPIKTDENGKPAQEANLANTGATGIVMWSVVGGLALAIGLFFLRRVKMQ